MLHSILLFFVSKGCFGAVCKFSFETLTFGDIVSSFTFSFFHPILINFTALLCSEDQLTHPISVPFYHPHSLCCWQLCLSCCPLCNANVCFVLLFVAYVPPFCITWKRFSSLLTLYLDFTRFCTICSCKLQ